jgi:tetratricopeptide (TPR) repeat protein
MQRIGQYDQAESEFQAALTRAQARNRLDEQAAAHNLLSFLAYLRSDYDGVGDHAQTALELATQAGELSLRGPGLRHLGIAVYRTGDYARARQLYDEALVAYRQAGDRLGMAGVYNNIGFVLRTQANYAEAIEAFQEALTIYEATGQVEGVALICSNIGRTYAFSGDLEQAQRYLERGLALSVESHTDWIAVKIHRTMGNIFAQNGQWSRALAHAQQAQTLASTLGSDEDLGAALRLLAEIASAWPERNLGNPATYFEQSIALLQRVGAQDELERAESAYANYIRDVVSPTGPLGS